MLKVPAYEYFPDHAVTAYQDDAKFWMFYLIPDYPAIRKDRQSGDPVFLLIKYAFSDDARAENPDLPKGGGFVAFDVELSVSQDAEDDIKAKLQKRVNEEWTNLKQAAERHGRTVQGARLSSWHYRDGQFNWASAGVDDLLLGLDPDAPEAPPGDRPPQVIISRPTWTEGTFEVSAPQSEHLVSHRVTAGKASLTGSNVASANMDLTPDGATFMQRTLLELDGTGASDLTPIQVTYNLKFWARVPPVRLRITADSRQLYQSIQQIVHDYDDNSCSEDDMSHYEAQIKMAVQSGLINVQLDTGTLALDDDFVEELRGKALQFVQELIKNTFFEKKEAEDGDDEDEDDPTDEFANAEKDIYYFKSIQDFSSVHFEYNEVMTSIVEWEINPQATMQTFFAGRSKDEMRRFIRQVDLTDSFFQSLGLKVNCFADWASEPIAFVEAQVQYEGRDENDERVEKVQTFTFTKDHTQDAWDPSLIGKKREYSYRWRVGFLGREAGEFTRWERDRTPMLNLSVADPGKIAVDVLAGNVDFKQITNQIQVDLRYSDQRSDVGEESMTIVLADGAQSRRYERYIYQEWDQPLFYRTRFFLKDGQRFESDWQPTTSRQLLVNEPQVDRLDVQLVPAGDWGAVVQSVISLRYADVANGYNTDQTFLIKTRDEFKSWAVLLRDRTRRRFEYKVLTTFQNGTFDQGDWTAADGDQALPIIARQAPRLTVKVLPTLLDFKITPVVECTMRYGQNGASEVETFTFTTGAAPVEWSVPVMADAGRRYSYAVTYHTAEGMSLPGPSETTDAEAVVIQKLLVPEVACTLNPKLVNFTETPLVEATIEYADPDAGIEATETLLFSGPTEQGFRRQVRESSPKDYRLTITYYMANGAQVTRDPVTLSKKQVVIPRYVA